MEKVNTPMMELIELISLKKLDGTILLYPSIDDDQLAHLLEKEKQAIIDTCMDLYSDETIMQIPDGDYPADGYINTLRQRANDYFTNKYRS